MSPGTPRPDLGRMGGQALVEVLGAFLSLPYAAVTPVHEPSQEKVSRIILVSVGLIGRRMSGEVRLEIPEAFAIQAAGALLGENPGEPPDTAAVDDLAGELGNMVAGRVASLLGEAGYPCELGLPRVVRLRESRTSEAGAEMVRSNWRCQGHILALEIHGRFPAT